MCQVFEKYFVSYKPIIFRVYCVDNRYFTKSQIFYFLLKFITLQNLQILTFSQKFIT